MQQYPPPGTYEITVAIENGHTTVPFVVPGAVGQLRGTVKDESENPISGATVRMYANPGYYDNPPAPVLGETTSGPDGSWNLGDVARGWYTVTAEAPGVVGQCANRLVYPDTVNEISFTLAVGQTLAQLRFPMQMLFDDTISAMSAETLRLSDITEQAAGHLNGAIDAWDIANAMGGILAGGVDITYSPAMAYISAYARETLAAIITQLVTEQAMTSIPLAGADAVIASGTIAVLPEGLNDWRRHEFSELIALEPYTTGQGDVVDAQWDFHQTAGFTPVDPGFDFNLARRMVESRAALLRRISEGELVIWLPPPDPSMPFGAVIYPLAKQPWLMEHAVLSLLGGTRKILTGITYTSGAIAVGVSMTGVGLPAGALAGTICVGSAKAGTMVSVAQLPVRWLASHTYVLLAEAWSKDMLVLREPYLTAKSFLEAEADDPQYLLAGNEYDASVTVDLHADYPGNLIPVLQFLPFAYKTANVHITNTGNTTSDFRVVAIGWWDYHLPGDWPYIGYMFGGVTTVKVPVSVAVPTGSGTTTLAPGEPATFAVPYLGVFVDPINAFSPHWFQVDVYSGPFLVETAQVPYYTIPSPVPLPGGPNEQPGVQLTFQKENATKAISEENFADFIPTVTTLADQTISPNEPMIEVPFIAALETWSVSFQLFADPTASVALRVYDSTGAVVGYDEEAGGVQQEFAASYSGAGSERQIVEIPNAGGRTYTVRAVLEGTISSEAVKIRLWALETPPRPAVMSVAPAQFGSRAYRGEEISFPVAVAEAGGQVPLEDVSVSLGAITGPGGATLPVDDPDTFALGLIEAGRLRDVSFRVSVPLGTPQGDYSGQVLVSSSNAGSQIIDITIEVVLIRSDFDGDNDVDSDDFDLFENCASGPAVPLAGGCEDKDLDGDGDVDQSDFGIFQRCYSGQGNPADPSCAG